MREHRRFRQVVAVCALLLVATAAWHLVFRSGAPASEQPAHAALDYSPVDLVLTSDETRALTVNQTANSVALVDLASGKIVAEAPCGDRPTNVLATPDGCRALATATFSGDLVTFDLSSDRLKQVGSLWLGFEPRGLAISLDGKLAYVALTTAASIAVVDIDRLQVLDRIAVGHWPRTLALSPDGKRLAVGCSGA